MVVCKIKCRFMRQKDEFHNIDQPDIAKLGLPHFKTRYQQAIRERPTAVDPASSVEEQWQAFREMVMENAGRVCGKKPRKTDKQWITSEAVALFLRRNKAYKY